MALQGVASGTRDSLRKQVEIGTFLFSIVIAVVRDPQSQVCCLHASLRNISARREAVQLNERLKATLGALSRAESEGHLEKPPGCWHDVADVEGMRMWR